jgi:DNA-directed RNA polymerase subunit F
MRKFDRITDKQSISNTINQFQDMNLDKNTLAKTIVEISPVDLDELSDFFNERFSAHTQKASNPQLA